MTAPVPPSTLDAPFTVQDRRRKGFFTLDNALFDQYGSQLKAHGLAVYVALARFVNQDGACWPSLATIAKRTGMSRMQVIREIGKLQELRLIAVAHQQGEKGEYRSNIYILLDIPEVVTAREQGSNTQLPPLVTDSDHPSNTQLPPLVTGSDHPSNCVLPKQDIENKTQKQNKTQRTTSRARARSNNNIGAQTDVVVASVSTSTGSTPNGTIPEGDRKALPATASAKNAVQPGSTIAAVNHVQPAAQVESDLQAGVSALIALGIARKVAQRLANQYSLARIEEKLTYLDFLQREQPDKVQNPRGWLRRAIEEDYAAPDGYQSAAQRKEAAAEQARAQAAQQLAFEEERRRAEAERESQQQAAAARQAQLQATYGTTQREFDLWQQILAEYKHTMPAATFQMYVAGMVLLSLQDEQALIGLPDKAVRAWVENRLTHKIQRTLAIAVGCRKITVTFVDLAADAALSEPAATGSGHTRDEA